ncbi:sodium/calcium exchanger NCL-like [Punica granatum]|uniref:Sodium/calcium exchanger NCL-like n=1 Tax=Punica granatum TaxID=22663 RepID=A0A218XVT1_PUNGR|nr:sodium/calcium exchanger NCL-like [Punica granatum]OWM88621.1 hypothetical protein CDL15_Pgr002388 [Punica granatum]
MAMKVPLFLLPLLLILLLLSDAAVVHSSRPVFESQLSDPISDGVTPHGPRNPPFLELLRPAASGYSSSESCEETYGFMPCTSTWLGNLFLILVYGYLMYLAATFLSGGSELLLEILGPGIVGGLFLPMLGALPDAMLILVSGLSGSTETAQSQVSVGMGLLAGSTVMLITVIWGTCVVVGKCDIENSVALDKQDTRGLNLTGSGVSTDIWTSYAAGIMVISVVPFIIVQVPQILGSTSGRHLAVLIALIASLFLLVAYCLYQVFQPWIQRRKLAYVEHKHVIFGFLRHIRKRALGKLLTDDGELDKEMVEKLFRTIDENGDGYLNAAELKALVLGIHFEELDLDEEDALTKIMKDFDTSNDYQLDRREFVEGISKWLNRAKMAGAASGLRNYGTMKFLDFVHHQTKREHQQLRMDDQSEEDAEGIENPKRTTLKAVLLLTLGTVIAAIFADPLVDAVDNFSDATSIPTFFISFIALPLATNSSEAVSAIIFATRKKQKTSSLTFSELYGAVTMNNVLCLSVFLAIVYIRGLTWDFSAEVLIILIICIVMGTFGSFRTTFPLWTSLIAFALYPFSLALVYVLDYVLGWS